ncbi:hypothetical protein DPMN_173738 [Dreissena polymorpha]|uniref:Uncharacterized protein n=1 Tax=Dreissena polymorpha TaxID=45954 RepID=A0A9D4IFT0_DREPO|nr:hypothetical protein DPMN_173738 [Dreissena polymorpha]
MSCAGSTSQSKEPETVAGCQVKSVWPERSTREPETVAGCQVESDQPNGSLSKTREPETVAGCHGESDQQKKEKEVVVPEHLQEVYKALIGKLTGEQAGALTGALFSEEVDDDIGLVEQGSFRTRGQQTTFQHGWPSVLSDVTEVESGHGVLNRMKSASPLDSYPWDPGGEPYTQSCRVLAGSFSQHPLKF